LRVLFSFAGGLGHANPMVPLARACGRAGHTVAFSGRASATSVLESQGFAVFTDQGEEHRSAEIAPLAEIDMDHEYEVLRSYFAGRLARERVPIVSSLAETWEPDVILCDEVDYGGMVAAELGGLAHVTVLSLAASFVRNASVVDSVNALRVEHELSSEAALAMPERHLVLSPFPPSLREPSGARTVAFRHTVREEARGAANATSSVYFTLGTEFNDESGDLFERVLEGLRLAGVHAVMTVGHEIGPSRFGAQPERIRIERFLPQEDVLASCDVVINHGGSGSMIGALSFGRPMIVIPLGADQVLNAERCEELGVAVVFDAMRLTPDDVRDAVERLVREPSYRERAEEIRDEIRDLPSPSRIVPEIEALIGRS
jgi:UDP:flavonoid glycosyltransferase YjiC (YdhE family)